MTDSDRFFENDIGTLENIKETHLWTSDPKYFKSVRISATASMRMLTHAMVGVEKGLKSANGFPLEVMGLVFGHIDPLDNHSLIVTDVCYMHIFIFIPYSLGSLHIYRRYGNCSCCRQTRVDK